jgi:hypothetical protein
MNVLDMVTLKVDLPAQGLKSGQIGTIVEEWQPGIFEIEFEGKDGHCCAMVAVREEDLAPFTEAAVANAAS